MSTGVQFTTPITTAQLGEAGVLCSRALTEFHRNGPQTVPTDLVNAAKVFGHSLWPATAPEWSRDACELKIVQSLWHLVCARLTREGDGRNALIVAALGAMREAAAFARAGGGE